MKKEKFKNPFIYLLAVQIVVLLSCIAIPAFSGRPVTQGLVYFLFQLTLVFLPGLAACAVFNIEYDDSAVLIPFSYFFGLCILMAEYLICAFIGHSLVTALCISLISVPILYEKKEYLNRDFTNLFSCVPLLTSMAIFVICFFAVTLSNPLPTPERTVIFNKDFLYWIGSSISLTKSFPVEDFRLAGFPFYYHYFSNVVIAQSSLISKIGIVDLSFLYSYIIPSILLAYSSYVLFSTILKRKSCIIAGIIICLFMEGSVCFLTSHLYFCPFGFDYGYAVAMLGIAYLARMYTEDDFSARSLIVSCMIIAANTGYKGPVSIVALIAYGIVAADVLFRRSWKKGLLFGLSWLASFVAVYAIFVMDVSGATEMTNNLVFLGPLRAFEENYWAMEILQDLVVNKGLPNNGLAYIAALFLYVIRNNRASMVLLIFGSGYLICELLRKRKVDILLLSWISIGLWGVLLTINTYQDGNSQMYFVMSCFPFCALSGLYSLEKVTERSEALIFILLALLAAVSYDDMRRFIDERANAKIRDAIAISQNKEVVGDKRYSLSYKEYELALWLKENTAPDVLIALDCFEYDGLRKEENLGVFSERFIWNDGQYADEKEKSRRRAIVDRLFDGNDSAIDELKKEKVSYVIETLSQNRIESDRLQRVYQNEDYIVFKVK